MGFDQIGRVGDDRVDVADEAEALVKVGDMDAHRLADQFHEVQKLERNIGLKLDELAVAAVEDRGEGRHPGRRGGGELALAQFGLELRQHRKVACLGADDRHVELDHFKSGDGAEHLLHRRHDTGQRRAFLQRDPLRHGMHE